MKVHLRIHKTVLSSDRHCYSDENRKMWHIIDDAHMLPKACFMWPASVMQPTHLICLYANQLPARFIREISKWKCMAPKLVGLKYRILSMRPPPHSSFIDAARQSEFPWREREGEGRKGPSIYDVRKILGFFDPSPLVRIWDWSTVLNSRNLPYYIFFWANPPSPLSADVINGCSPVTVPENCCNFVTFSYFNSVSPQPCKRYGCMTVT